MVKKYIYTIIACLFISLAFGKEKDSVVTVNSEFFKNSARQLDYLYDLNRSDKGDKWYIFFLGSDREELDYIIKASKYNRSYDSGRLAELNEKLTKINRESPDYEVYAALTDFGKVLQVTSLFDGKTLNEHIEEIERQLSDDSFSALVEQEELKRAKSNLVNFPKIRKTILDSIYSKTTNFKNSEKSNHFLPYVMNITYETLANFEGGSKRKQFFTWGLDPKKKNGKINKPYLNELYKRFDSEPDKTNIHRFAEAKLSDVVNALEHYTTLPDVEGLKQGIGQEVYQLYTGQFTTGSPQDRDLIELANHLTDDYNGEKFVVNYDCSEQGCDVEESLITVVSEKNIRSLGEFQEAFPYQGSARLYKNGQNTSTDYYSSIDLWQNLNPSTYNIYSFDYFIEDSGHTDVYRYSMPDLLMRYKVFTDPSYSNIETIILDSERSGYALAISYEDFYDQYYHKYDTNSALFFIAEWSARMAKEPLQAYFGLRIAVEQGAFLIGEMSKTLGRELVYKLIKEKGKDALQGAVIDYGVQAAFNYILDDRFATFQDAASPSNINWTSVAWSAGENTIKYNKLLAELGISGAGACLVNGFSEAGGFKDEFDYQSCAINVAITYGIKAVFKAGSSPYLKKQAIEAFKNGKDKLRNLLLKRGIPEDKVDDFIEVLEKNADDGDKAAEDIADIGNSWPLMVGKKIDNITNAPKGYQFYTRYNKKWIRRIDASDPDTPQLTVKDGKVARYSGETIARFTTKQIDDYAIIATKNKGSQTIMLGKFNQGGVSYKVEAGKKHTYFELDNWDDIYNAVNQSDDEIWQINAKFLDNQFKAKKNFYFSHDPSKATGFFKFEVDYIKNILKAKDIVVEGKYWKVVW